MFSKQNAAASVMKIFDTDYQTLLKATNARKSGSINSYP